MTDLANDSTTMPKNDDHLIWMTSNAAKAAQVGANVIDQSVAWGLKKPPAVVFDVDETLILNHPTDDDRFKVQPVGKALFEFASKRNVPVFIVTARAKSQWARRLLQKQLEKAGYDLSNVKGVYMQPKEFVGLEDGGAAFKKKARAQIEASHTIVLNAGDRWGDVTDRLLDHEARPEHVSGVREPPPVGAADAVRHQVSRRTINVNLFWPPPGAGGAGGGAPA